MTLTQPPSMAPLSHHGYTHFRAADVFPHNSAAELNNRLAPLRDHYAKLPSEPHAHHTNRYRCYARGVVIPWTRTITWAPGIPHPTYGHIAKFSQGDHNPEYPDQTRIFPYAAPSLLTDPTLGDLILFDLDHTDWPATAINAPIHVGVHFVKLLVNQPNQIAVSSPDCLHQDGGTNSVYFVHLLERSNTTGGLTVIAEPACAGIRADHVKERQIYAQFKLDQPLDSYAIIDSRVSHYVTPIQAANPQQPAHRSAVLIGLIPYSLPI